VLAVWAVEQQRSADVVRGLAGGIFHLSCPKLFRVARTECGSGVAKALSQAARHVLLGRVDESRRGRAQYRCLGLAQQV
jgi:hypothetical protein